MQKIKQFVKDWGFDVVKCVLIGVIIAMGVHEVVALIEHFPWLQHVFALAMFALAIRALL